ncbi:host cell factor-like [Anastrepha obliqua]|uniref:host cell factor-like n=1 Tax=Anastrepha obliqua TaxID=95512 RepID=UPI00240A14EB|nr:host cell factor-like [Anastrepha obliqua]
MEPMETSISANESETPTDTSTLMETDEPSESSAPAGGVANTGVNGNNDGNNESAATDELRTSSTDEKNDSANANDNSQSSDQHNGVSSTTDMPPPPPSTGSAPPGESNVTATTTGGPPIDEEDAKWHTVGIYTGLNATVSSYIDNSIWSSSGLKLTSRDLPDLSTIQRVNLEPGTAYRFRLRAINTCGASDWSEISSFKTCLPGFPGAPSAIKISKSSEGAHLTWEPPPSCVNSNEIIEYSVYLAVKPGKDKDGKPIGAGARLPAQLAFVRVYVGAANQCTVAHSSLATAHVDCSNKPAIIFRIAARNDKGYGPATQVRWLQDPVQSGASPGSGLAGGAGSIQSPTRIKPELGSASPNKRFKGSGGVGGGGRAALP